MMPAQRNERFLTGGLGQALALQNERTREVLAKEGHVIVIDGKPKLSPSKRLSLDYPFTHDLGFAKMAASIGRTVARDLVSVTVADPLVWPDMKKLAEEAKAAHPMTEETKAKLRQLSVDKPRNVGDETARQLEGKTLPEVYEIAAKYLGEDLKALLAKYKHLNPGQQRMVCGNRMRAKWKAEHLYAKTRGTGIDAGTTATASESAADTGNRSASKAASGANERPSRGLAPNAPSPRVSPQPKGGTNAIQEKDNAKTAGTEARPEPKPSVGKHKPHRADAHAEKAVGKGRGVVAGRTNKQKRRG